MNSRNITFELGITPFIYISNEEFKATHFHGNMDCVFSRKTRTEPSSLQSGALEAAVDWRKRGVLSGIVNQDQCGSCYAIATASMIAAEYRIKGQKIDDLSAQQIVDCSTAYGNSGCDGGSVVSSFEYVRDKGLTTAKSYPYVGKEQPCKNVTSPLYKVKDIYRVTYATEEKMQQLVSQSPITISIYSSSMSFQVREGGRDHA